MFESGSYRTHPEHVALYEALEASMEQTNRDEFLTEKDMSCLTQPPAPQSSAWKTSDTREAPSSSSRQKSAPHSEQPVKDVPIPDDVNISYSRPGNLELGLVPDGRVSLAAFTDHSDWVIMKDLEYQVSSDKGRRSTLSISKLKAAQYLDFRLEELVPSLWIKSERDYDISAAYVNMWIRNIVIRKYVEDLQLGIESYQTKLNLTQPDWDASNFLFKEDYTIVSKPRVVIYKDKNDQKKMMQETEVHKFSNGTLNKIMDKLDHMVKDFKLFKYNPGIETRIWSEDNRRRSKEFMEVIKRRLKIRRIFRSLESFVSGRLRDVDYRLIQRTE
ncbi:hypothetical protein Tco_1036585 [Tanacetum coccineum]